MTSNTQERKFLIEMLSASWMHTENWKQRTLFRAHQTILYRCGTIAVPVPVFKKVKEITLSGEQTRLVKIGYTYEYIESDLAKIYTTREKMIDTLEDIKELITTRSSVKMNGWQYIYASFTPRLRVKIHKLDDQFLGGLAISREKENQKLLDQILKGIISEL